MNNNYYNNNNNYDTKINSGILPDRSDTLSSVGTVVASNHTTYSHLTVDTINAQQSGDLSDIHSDSTTPTKEGGGGVGGGRTPKQQEQQQEQQPTTGSSNNTPRSLTRRNLRERLKNRLGNSTAGTISPKPPAVRSRPNTPSNISSVVIGDDDNGDDNEMVNTLEFEKREDAPPATENCSNNENVKSPRNNVYRSPSNNNDSNNSSSMFIPVGHGNMKATGMIMTPVDRPSESRRPKTSAEQQKEAENEAELAASDIKKYIASVQGKMKEPSKTLSDLLVAIKTPGDDDDDDDDDDYHNNNIEEIMDRGFMVRRKNACGALKVLTAKKENQMPVCWTIGVLPALTSVLQDIGTYDDTHNYYVGLKFLDVPTRNEYVEARKRAVSCLLNLAIPKENRLLMYYTPGLVKALVETIKEDVDDSRQGCCAILSYLSRTAENRVPIVKEPGLIDAIATVLNPKTESDPLREEKNGRLIYSLDFLNPSDSTELLSSRSMDPSSPSTNGGIHASTSSSTYEIEIGTSGSSADDDDDDDDDSHSDASGSDGTSHSSGSSGSSHDDDDDDESDDEDSTIDGDSDITPKMSTSPRHLISPKKYNSKNKRNNNNKEQVSSRNYDNHKNPCLNSARQHIFAMMRQLVKEKENAYLLARNESLINTLVSISRLQDSIAHSHAVAIFANLTRHRDNSKWICFRLRTVVPALVRATYSSNNECRKFALFALQNLSQDKPCRQEVANTPNVLRALCIRARQATDEVEKLAAISSLKNLTDEPANLVPMTNTEDCFATFIWFAKGDDEHITDMMSYIACDGLATLSHWLRKVATSGAALNSKNKNGSSKKQDLSQMNQLFVPSMKVIDWNQWK